MCVNEADVCVFMYSQWGFRSQASNTSNMSNTAHSYESFSQALSNLSPALKYDTNAAMSSLAAIFTLLRPLIYVFLFVSAHKLLVEPATAASNHQFRSTK